MASPERHRISARLAAVEKHNGPHDPRLPGLRRDLRAAELEERIRKLVDAAPPLTDQQRARLRALLAPANGNAS